jgi:hypothetical protein
MKGGFFYVKREKYHSSQLSRDVSFNELFTKKPEEVNLKRRLDYQYILDQLKRKDVTLMLLWEEYVETNKLTMRIDRKPGEKCEIDVKILITNLLQF